ncbi:MAG: glycoside hydrolase [Acidobacteria bacterium]|nr:MAG: glycoside hydrolase [Acidobacteriota bacterium]
MRYVCIHGHFYQPPRENPSLEAVELQDSAYPYHDWNQRITAECYAPNAVSRVLDNENRILKLVSNYSQISFNFGPTLLSWLKSEAPKVYEAILEADKISAARFSGHGSAMAQGYNHMILPLANHRDKVTQVKWGIRDFESRFGRKPEGMWLPETAVDTETLEVLAENDIKFTILAPRQAKRVRSKRAIKWQDVSDGGVDPSHAYFAELPSKRKIQLFFYDGPISQGVAFEGLLNDGRRFAERLISGFSETRRGPQLVHLATDGESYGHHHHYGEMALSYALHYIEENKLAQLTNYGEFLEKFPPSQLAEIVENSSWSCVHGVERWRSNCGCNSGGHAWNQEWRAPLRAALDWLRDRLAPIFEKNLSALLRDPWTARHDYIRVILDRSEESRAAFFAEHALRPLNEQEQVLALRLLEMQRHAMLMYTSCGWFFDELSGIETAQVLHYAGRAVQLAQECCGEALEAEFLQQLAKAKSNLPEHGDGAQIYEKWVKPAFVDIERVAGHYAISSLFENYGDKTRVYCYDVERENYSLEAEGKMRLATGSARLRSEITQESAAVKFAVLHLGDHNITAGVKPLGAATNGEFHQQLVKAFVQADTAEAIRLLDQAFEERLSLRLLFRDEQRKIAKIILNESLTSAAAVYRAIFENQAPLLRFLTGLSIPVPNALKAAAEIALNNQLQQLFERPELDADSLLGLLKETAATNIALDTTTLEYAMRQRLEKEAAEFAANPGDPVAAERLRKSMDLIPSLPFPVTLWEVQNICYPALVKAFEENGLEAREHDPAVRQYFDDLTRLATQLQIRIPEPALQA